MKSPIGSKAWNASKNLVDPEPKTRDGHISARRARELSQDTTDNAEFEKLYPRGLEALNEPCAVEVYSDSKYVIDALEKGWAKGWKARGSTKEEVVCALVHASAYMGIPRLFNALNTCKELLSENQ